MSKKNKLVEALNGDSGLVSKIKSATAGQPETLDQLKAWLKNIR